MGVEEVSIIKNGRDTRSCDSDRIQHTIIQDEWVWWNLDAVSWSAASYCFASKNNATVGIPKAQREHVADAGMSWANALPSPATHPILIQPTKDKRFNHKV